MRVPASPGSSPLATSWLALGIAARLLPIGALLVLSSLVLSSLVLPSLGLASAAGAQATEAEPATDGTDAADPADAPEGDANPGQADAGDPDAGADPVTVPDAGVLVPGSPTTDADTDGADGPAGDVSGDSVSGDSVSGDGISVDREQASEGIKPSSVLTLVIGLLLVVGVSLAVLTLAYWFRTRPSKNPGVGATSKRKAPPTSDGERTPGKRPVESGPNKSRPAPASDGPRRPNPPDLRGDRSALPTASRAGASEPTAMTPAVDVGVGGTPGRAALAAGGPAALARPRPTRSDKADRDALVQRVRQDSTAEDQRPVDKASLGRASASNRAPDSRASDKRGEAATNDGPVDAKNESVRSRKSSPDDESG